MSARLALPALIAALACSPAEAPQPPPAAPRTPRAAVVIEPTRILVGDVAAVDVVVVTPPGHSVRPVAPPDSLDNVWLLDAVAQPVVRDDENWTHRTRIRVRGRSPGPVDWPALHLDVEGPEDERWSLETEPRTFEVVSILPQLPDRVAPFPYAPVPTPAATAASPWLAAAGGAAATLACVAVVALVRRRRGRRALRRAEAALAVEGAPWTVALDVLATARARVAEDWRAAGDVGALVLRRYVTRRFRLPIDCCTTEEAESLSPPFALAGHWPRILELLRALDALRFRPEHAPGAERQVEAALDGIEHLVRETIPPEAER